ncbi:hypothetical protein [Bradyrhizobium macuxiense]|uniref:hypothetical protein n=1 Tax=Bradyrhizobium macuxiense TaxID=1755647 RepID=UPI0010A96ADE|nr:hypothetical protein [Bradyrhizobium macuxiense]
MTLIGRIEKMPVGKITPSIDRHKLECSVVEQMIKSLKRRDQAKPDQVANWGAGCFVRRSSLPGYFTPAACAACLSQRTIGCATPTSFADRPSHHLAYKTPRLLPLPDENAVAGQYEPTSFAMVLKFRSHSYAASFRKNAAATRLR